MVLRVKRRRPAPASTRPGSAAAAEGSGQEQLPSEFFVSAAYEPKRVGVAAVATRLGGVQLNGDGCRSSVGRKRFRRVEQSEAGGVLSADSGAAGSGDAAKKRKVVDVTAENVLAKACGRQRTRASSAWQGASGSAEDFVYDLYVPVDDEGASDERHEAAAGNVEDMADVSTRENGEEMLGSVSAPVEDEEIRTFDIEDLVDEDDFKMLARLHRFLHKGGEVSTRRRRRRDATLASNEGEGSFDDDSVLTSSDEEELRRSDDDDSNAEDYYQNDYPDEEEGEDDSDEDAISGRRMEGTVRILCFYFLSWRTYSS